MSESSFDVSSKFRLDGRTALVTGAGGHLGRAMSLALAQAGAEVILNGRSEERLTPLKQQIEDAGFAARIAPFEIMDEAASSKAVGALDRLDILINNAFTGLAGTDEAANPEAFRTALDSGLSSAYRLVQEALPALDAAVAAVGQASVINITSIYGHVSPDPRIYERAGFVNPPFYAATKGGLLQLTRYMACHLAARKIRVNSLSPGLFPWDNIHVDRPDFIRDLENHIPMGRTGRADEIAGPALFLASDASSFMTGNDLCIDGGWTAW